MIADENRRWRLLICLKQNMGVMSTIVSQTEYTDTMKANTLFLINERRGSFISIDDGMFHVPVDNIAYIEWEVRPTNKVPVSK